VTARAGLLLLLLFATGCAKPLDPQRGSKPAPAFSLPDLAGGTLGLASLQGKVVVLDFWATWCAPCLKEIPDYADFWKRNQPRGVEVIGVVFDSGDPQDIADFVREHKIPYRQLVGDDKLKEDYGGELGFPTTFVIDGHGMVRSKILGNLPDKFERLQREVDAALATP
jgi:peroxiredoxin